MPLRDINDHLQNPVGRGEHWRLFVPFQSTPLYRAIMDELDSYVVGKTSLDSSWAGSDILSRLESRSPELFETHDSGETGGLFGMTVWNYLAQRPDDWYFVLKDNQGDDPTGTKYFRIP